VHPRFGEDFLFALTGNKKQKKAAGKNPCGIIQLKIKRVKYLDY